MGLVYARECGSSSSSSLAILRYYFDTNNTINIPLIDHDWQLTSAGHSISPLVTDGRLVTGSTVSLLE